MKLERIRIGDRDLPIRIDYNVIEEIEEEYETLEKFRMELLGFKWKRGDDGKYIYDDEGKPVPELTKPSMRALNFILPIMINAGIKAEAYEMKKPYEPIDPELIIMECEIERNFLMEIINREMERCQRVKKSTPGEAGTKSKKR